MLEAVETYASSVQADGKDAMEKRKETQTLL
jgi:hypothetical protein